MNIVVLLILILAGAAVLAAGIVALVFFILHLAGGEWRRLVEAYATDRPPEGQILQHQTVKIGAVRYRRCATAGVADDGLYLLVGRKTVLIPWDDITDIGQAMLDWQQVPVLMIGEPAIGAITVQKDLFTEVEPHLTKKAPATSGC